MRGRCLNKKIKRSFEGWEEVSPAVFSVQYTLMAVNLSFRVMF